MSVKIRIMGIARKNVYIKVIISLTNRVAPKTLAGRLYVYIFSKTL